MLTCQLSPRRGSIAAFTLIELLVVIAIISILAGILFPVFAAAREKARQATCESNLDQIGLAFMQYVQDFDEMYPCDTSDPYLWQGEHFRWKIMPYLAIGQTKVSTPGSYAATSSNAQILTCPSDPSASFNETSYAYAADFYLSSKQLSAVTSFLDLYGPPYGTLPIVPAAQCDAQLSEPTQKILAGEWTDNHDHVVNPPVGWYPNPGTPDTFRNYLFADGHVKYWALSQIQNGYTGVPDPNTTIGGIGGADVL
jgi:prepilin-type N-terminal cleavage/methylation domain-containing protein/prepilin-type processing-associated H-X9-DG protein